MTFELVPLVFLFFGVITSLSILHFDKKNTDKKQSDKNEPIDWSEWDNDSPK